MSRLSLPVALAVFLGACASTEHQYSIHEIAEAQELVEQGRYGDADDILVEYKVEDFDLATQRDFNLLKAQVADGEGDWSAAIRYYEAYMRQVGPADNARQAEQRLLDLGTELLDGEHRFLWIFTDRSRGVMTLENLALLGTTPTLRAEAMARAAEYYYGEQDYSAAMNYYAGLLQPSFSGLGWEDSATFRLAMCHYRLIKPDKLNGATVLFAIDQLKAYLDQFPGGLHRAEAESNLDSSCDLLSLFHLGVGNYYLQIGDLDGASYHYALGGGQTPQGNASIADLVRGTPHARLNLERLEELPQRPTGS